MKARTPATSGKEYPLAFIVLAHGEWSTLAGLIDTIAADPFDTVIVHLDRKSDWRKRKAVEDYFYPRKNVIVFSEVRCKWGGISLVDATLIALRRLKSVNRRYEYVSLLSGIDYPIKPLHQLRNLLDSCNKREFIEVRDFYTERWIKTGIYAERFEYWFPFARSGWLSRPFKLWYHLMRAIDRRRLMTPGFVPYSGSQWWTMSLALIEWILADQKTVELRQRMKSSFIPDEMFFQTLVMSSPFAGTVTSENLHHVEWLPTGTPRNFDLPDLDTLSRSPKFFGRKIVTRDSPELVDRIKKELLRGSGVTT